MPIVIGFTSPKQITSHSESEADNAWNYPEHKMATIQLDPTTIFIAGTVWAALWASLGWFANHKLSTVRDRNERQRKFRGFMSGFQSWSQRSGREKVGNEFSAQVRLFCEQAAIIKPDLPKKEWQRFDEIVQSICRMRARDVNTIETNYSGNGPRHIPVGKKRLLDAIDEMIKMIE